ncbi:MAG: hypothetical protein N2Z70_02555 [Bdellovibrionaceae bacterium]|nr:hypothetical protein [Pseudobdellovibrionaceae bacterium]
MSQTVTCPQCGQNASHLKTLSEGLIRKLEEAGHSGLPQQMCESCYQQYAGQVARGAVLMAEMKAREQKKMMIWKSRVGLLKKARALMKEKAFADAAIAYEKYLKVLETIYEVGNNELTPEHLKSTARTQEITVVASVYWDLLRIYDTSDRYTQRQEQVAKKLAEFLPFTPLLPDLVKKAQAFEKSAKKAHIIRNFLKQVTEKKSRCFVVTACISPHDHLTVLRWRAFRDHVLRQHLWGRRFIAWYYRHSPAWAAWLHEHPFWRRGFGLAFQIGGWMLQQAMRLTVFGRNFISLVHLEDLEI